MNDRQIDNLMVGSIIKHVKSGRLRIVRHVTRYTNHKSPKYGSANVWGITVVISRCSWTQRPTTIILRSDIRAKYEYTGLRVADVNEALTNEIMFNSSCMPWDQSMTCCDVIGIP